MAAGSLLHPRKLFSYTRKLLIRVRDLFIRVCEPRIRACDQDIIGFSFFEVRRRIHWRSFPVECRPMWDGRISNTSMNQTLNSVLTKAWPHDGECETARKRELGNRFNQHERVRFAGDVRT